MEDLVAQVSQVFAKKFPGASVELEIYPGDERVGGYVIWDGFDEFDHLDRQRQLVQALRECFGDTFRAKVTTILAVTPAEVSVMREG